MTNFQNKCIIGQLRLLVNVWLFADSRALGHFGSVDGVVDDVDGVDGYGCVDAVDGVVGVDGVDDHGHQSHPLLEPEFNRSKSPICAALDSDRRTP